MCISSSNIAPPSQSSQSWGLIETSVDCRQRSGFEIIIILSWQLGDSNGKWRMSNGEWAHLLQSPSSYYFVMLHRRGHPPRFSTCRMNISDCRPARAREESERIPDQYRASNSIKFPFVQAQTALGGTPGAEIRLQLRLR